MKEILDHEPHVETFEKNSVRRFFTRYLFWVMLLLYIIQCKYTWIGCGSWELNRSDGWSWASGWAPYIIAYTFNALFLFALGYLVLSLLKRSANFKLSVVHFLMAAFNLLVLWNIFSVPLFYRITDIPFFHFFFLVIMWLVFVLNLYFSKRVFS